MRIITIAKALKQSRGLDDKHIITTIHVITNAYKVISSDSMSMT